MSYVSNLFFFFQDSFVVPLLLVLSSLQNHTTRILQFKYIKFHKYVFIEIAMITKWKASIFRKQRHHGRIKRKVQVAFSQTSKFFSVKARFNFVDLNSHCAWTEGWFAQPKYSTQIYINQSEFYRFLLKKSSLLTNTNPCYLVTILCTT